MIDQERSGKNHHPLPPPRLRRVVVVVNRTFPIRRATPRRSACSLPPGW